MPVKNKVKNRISLLLHKAVTESNSVEVKQALIDQLHQKINPKRLTGLINNTYEIKVEEMNILSKVLGCTMEELVEL